MKPHLFGPVFPRALAVARKALLALGVWCVSPVEAAAQQYAPTGGAPEDFTSLFRLQVRGSRKHPWLDTGIDSMRGNARLEARFTALWAYHAYLYDNYCHAFRQERELLKLLPDKQALRARYDALLLADTAFQRLMTPTTHGARVAPLHIDSALRIAARFYYVHREGQQVVTHVCTGLNRVMDLGTSFDAAHHAAFGYLVVRNMEDPYAPYLALIEPYRAEMRANPTDERVKELEQLVYERMARSPELRAAIIAVYERNKAFLPFELML